MDNPFGGNIPWAGIAANPSLKTLIKTTIVGLLSSLWAHQGGPVPFYGHLLDGPAAVTTHTPLAISTTPISTDTMSSSTMSSSTISVNMIPAMTISTNMPPSDIFAPATPICATRVPTPAPAISTSTVFVTRHETVTDEVFVSVVSTTTTTKTILDWPSPTVRSHPRTPGLDPPSSWFPSPFYIFLLVMVGILCALWRFRGRFRDRLREYVAIRLIQYGKSLQCNDTVKKVDPVDPIKDRQLRYLKDRYKNDPESFDRDYAAIQQRIRELEDERRNLFQAAHDKDVAVKALADMKQEHERRYAKLEDDFNASQEQVKELVQTCARQRIGLEDLEEERASAIKLNKKLENSLRLANVEKDKWRDTAYDCDGETKSVTKRAKEADEEVARLKSEVNNLKITVASKIHQLTAKDVEKTVLEQKLHETTQLLAQKDVDEAETQRLIENAVAERETILRSQFNQEREDGKYRVDVLKRLLRAEIEEEICKEIKEKLEAQLRNEYEQKMKALETKSEKTTEPAKTTESKKKTESEKKEPKAKEAIASSSASPLSPSTPLTPETLADALKDFAITPKPKSEATAGPSTPGPSTPGPSAAGPSTSGPSTSGPTTSGPTTEVTPEPENEAAAGPSTAGPPTAVQATTEVTPEAENEVADGPSTVGQSTAAQTTEAAITPEQQNEAADGPSTPGPSTAVQTTEEAPISPNDQSTHDVREYAGFKRRRVASPKEKGDKRSKLDGAKYTRTSDGRPSGDDEVYDEFEE